MRQIIWLLPALGLILLSLVAPYLRTDFPYTHDGENHLARFANYKVAVREGQVPPRWAPNLVNRYGYPVFNFNYPLFNLLSLPFSIVGIHYELTFKVLVSACLLLGLLGWWQFSKYGKLTHTSRLYGLFVYGLSPFIVSSVYFRGNIGEIGAYSLFPWLFAILLWLKTNPQLFTPKKWQWWAALVAITAFLLVHNVSVLLALVCLTPIIIGFWQRSRATWQAAVPLAIVAITLTSWFWLPALFEKSATVLEQAQISNQTTEHALTLSQQWWQPLSFGFSRVGPVDDLAVGVGWLGMLFFNISLGLAVGNREYRRKWGLIVSMVLFLLFMQLPQVVAYWGELPGLNFIQFPWRLQLILMPILALLVSSVYQVLQTNPFLKYLMWLLVLISLMAIWRTKPADFFHRNVIDYDLFSQSTSTMHENRPKDFTFTEIGNWQPTAIFLEGEGTVTVSHWTGTRRKYTVDVVSQQATLVEPTANFPGWLTTVNGNKVPHVDSAEIGGRLAYKLAAGRYQVHSSFTQQTISRILGNGLTIAGLISLAVIGIKKKPWLQKQK